MRPPDVDRTGPIDTRALKQTVRLEDVAARYAVELRRHGRALVGRCPLHADRGRPNFYIYPEQPQSWRCYRCGIRRLLRRAALTFSPEARAFGVEEAKGLLLVGLPGCGKDTIKNAAPSVLGRALLDLDMGAVMGEGGGLIGSAELSIKRALQIATTTKCVLGLGEYEKAVGGMQSSARTDGGATSRVVGSLLNWLAEPHPGVFVIATANDVRELAPEQVREGRFTPVFVDLPTRDDRADIFRVHLAKRRREPADFDLDLLGEASEGYSGAASLR